MALLFELVQKTVLRGFSALWAIYPNHNGKKDAEKAYGQVVKTREIEDQVFTNLEWQIPYWESLEWYHPPYLATYLRKGRYLDPPPTPPKPKGKVAPPRFTMTAAQQTAEVIRLMQTGMSRNDAIAKVFNETRDDS